MDRKKILISVFSGLSAVVLCCVLFASVNNNQDVSSLISTGKIQEQVAEEPQPSLVVSEPQADNSGNYIESSKNPTYASANNNPAAKQEGAKVVNPEDEYFVVGGGQSETNSVASLNSDFVPNAEDDKVCWKIEGGTLYLKAFDTNVEPTEGYQRNVIDSEGRPGWFSKFLPVGAVVIDNSFGPSEKGGLDVKMTKTKSWFSTAYMPGRSQGRPHVKKFTGLNNLNLSEVVDSSFMFAGCGSYGLTDSEGALPDTLELSKAQDASAMFASAQVKKLFNNDGNVNITFGEDIVNLDYLFQNTTELTSFDLQESNLSKATSASFMFCGCEGLQSVNFPVENSFKLNQMTSIEAIFCGCKNLSELDLTSWSGNPINNVGNAFNSCVELKKILVKEGTDWTGAQYKPKPDSELQPCKYAFYNCSKSLEGSNGTKFSEDNLVFAQVDLANVVKGDGTIGEIPGLFSAVTTKAVLTSSSKNDTNDTLTYYTGDLCLKNKGTVYQGKNATTDPDNVPWKNVRSSIKIINYDSSFDNNNYDFSYSFYGCTGLTAIKIPPTVKTIGAHCYDGCTNLKKVVVDRTGQDNQLHVKSCAFANCPTLENYVVRNYNNEEEKTVQADDISYDSTDIFSGSTTDSNRSKFAAPLIYAGPDGGTTKTFVSDTLIESFYNFVKEDGRTNVTDSASRNKEYAYYYLEGDVTAGTFNGPLYYILAKNCIFDLNGHTLDRNATSTSTDENKTNQIFRIHESTNMAVHSWDHTVTQNFRIDDTNSIDCGSNNVGKLTGAYGSVTGGNYGGAICAGHDGMKYNLNLYIANGRITSNQSTVEGSAIALRSAYNSSGDEIAKTVLHVYGGKIYNNSVTTAQTSVYGGAIKVMQASIMKMYGGSIVNNNVPDGYNGPGVYVEAGTAGAKRPGQLHLYGGNITGNTINNLDKGSIYISGENADFVPYGGEYTAQNAALNTNLRFKDNGTGDLPDILVNGVDSKTKESDYCLNIPKTFNKRNIVGINEYAFKNDTHVKKVTVEAPSLDFTVCNNAFQGANKLENFVVKTSDDTHMFYQSKAFNEAGTTDPKVAAPLILAGGAKTISFTGSSNLKRYTFFACSSFSSTSVGYQMDKATGTYYYLANDIIIDKRLVVGVGGGTSDYVLDLNGKKIDRGFGAITSHPTTSSENYVMCTYNSCKLDFRIDNTACINTSDNLNGQITGGYTYHDSNVNECCGGGLCISQTNSTDQYKNVSLVNGCFVNNRTYGGKGGAVSLNDNYIENQGPAAENKLTMYGGVIKGNTSFNVRGDTVKATDYKPGTEINGQYTLHAPSCGAIYVGNSTTFNMYGGHIYDNRASDTNYQSSRSAVSPGGAVGIVGGTMNMYGGKIGGKTADDNNANIGCFGSAVYVIGQDQTLSGATTTLIGKFSMYGGSLLYNRLNAQSTYYGGVCQAGPKYGTDTPQKRWTLNQSSKVHFENVTMDTDYYIEPNCDVSVVPS